MSEETSRFALPHDRYTYREATVQTTHDEYVWLKTHAAQRFRILVAGLHEGRETGAMAGQVRHFIVGCCDFGCHFSEPLAEQVFLYFAKGLANAIITSRLRIHVGRFHEIATEDIDRNSYDMFVLNQPYDSADEAARDIQRGISLCQPAALICGTCYSNPATKEAVDKLLPFRQLFGNIWFGYL